MTPSKCTFECTATCGVISRYQYHSKLACYVGCHLLYSFVFGIPVLERQAGKGCVVLLWCVPEGWWFWEEGLRGLHFCSVVNGFMYLWHKINDAASVSVCVEASDALGSLTWYVSTGHLRSKSSIEISVAFMVESVLFSCTDGRNICYKWGCGNSCSGPDHLVSGL